MEYDIIVIGGGLGGLFAGAKLAKEGKSVLLLEQHDRPGGCATTFTRKDYTIEVGLHEMDGLHEGDAKNKIFEELGIVPQVEFIALPEFFHFKRGSLEFTMPHAWENASNQLSDLFPEEKKGIQTYFARLMNARRINVMERNLPDISIGEYLDSIIKNDDLKLILLGNLGYFGDDPYSLSLRYYSMAESSYFHGRANFIKGGSQQLSNRLVEIIREHGGKVLLNHKVSNIEVDDGEVKSIRFINQLPGEHLPVNASAGQYVLNAALPSILELVQSKEKDLFKRQLEDQVHGNSLLSAYFGFSKSLKELGFSNYSSFVFDESVKSMKDIKKNNHADFDQRSFTFVDYSQIDSGLSKEGKSVGVICSTDYLDDWTGLSREEYKQKKKVVLEKLSKRLEELIPGCTDYIEYSELGTAKTVQRYTLNPAGAVYGFAQLPNRKLISKIDGITNLHIASAWGKFGGGFSGAIFSGYMTANDILRIK